MLASGVTPFDMDCEQAHMICTRAIPQLNRYCMSQLHDCMFDCPDWITKNDTRYLIPPSVMTPCRMYCKNAEKICTLAAHEKFCMFESLYCDTLVYNRLSDFFPGVAEQSPLFPLGLLF